MTSCVKMIRLSNADDVVSRSTDVVILSAAAVVALKPAGVALNRALNLSRLFPNRVSRLEVFDSPCPNFSRFERPSWTSKPRTCLISSDIGFDLCDGEVQRPLKLVKNYFQGFVER